MDGRALRPRRGIPPIMLTDPVPKEKKSRKEYSQNQRDKRKKDPELHQLFKDCEKLRLQDYRERQSEASKQRNRELQRERQRRYRQRKKDVEVAQPRTRKQSEKLRTQWREQKKNQRARMSRQKVTSSNQKRREFYTSKKSKKNEDVSTPSTSTQQTPPRNPPKDQKSTASSRTAKSRHKKKLLDGLPSDRTLKADVFCASIHQQTPRSKKIIANRLGISISTPSSDLKESLTYTLKRLSRSKTDMVRRRIIANTLMSKKKNMKLMKSVGISKKVVRKMTKISRETKWQEFRNRRQDAVSGDDMKTVKNFYHHGEISSDNPNPRSTIKKNGTLLSRKVMSTTLHSAYDRFKVIHPEVKIGFSTFKRLRPIHIVPRTENKYRECLCEYCVNIELKLQAVDRALTSSGKPELKIGSKYKLSDMTLCARQHNGHHSKTCIDRHCGECGVNRVKDHLECIVRVENIHWYRWQQGEVGGLIRTTKVEKSGTGSDLLKEMCKELDPFSYHLFNARWQYEQYKSITAVIPPNTVVMCMDFGENYTCKAQDAPQGYHWNNTQCTIHPAVASYNCPDPNCTKIVSDSIIFISNDLKHDQHAVQHFTKKATELLKGDNITVNRLIMFSDGAPTQYKSKINFTDCSYGYEDFNVPVEKHFFGSRHGKGPCDREIGVVKKSVNMAVVARQANISTPLEFYDVCKGRLTQPRHGEDHVHMKRRFLYVKKGDVDRNRPARTHVKPVKNTRKLHCVRAVRAMCIEVRERSCFCEACRRGDECTMKEIAGEWSSEIIRATVAARGPVELEEVMDVEEPATDNPVADPPADDPPADDPPSSSQPTIPPANDLPANNSPANALPTNPPANVPAVNLPADDSPSSSQPTIPPANDLPANNSPANALPANPPADNQPADDPPSSSQPTILPANDLPANNSPANALPANPPADDQPADDSPSSSQPTILPANDLPANALPANALPANPPTNVPPVVKYGDYIKVLLLANNRTGNTRTYVGLIHGIDHKSNEMEVAFMRRHQSYFFWPAVQDKAWVPLNSVMEKLEPPTYDARGHLLFKFLLEEKAK
ncbi:uncharacterized protein LOC100891453 [Strongylocentrotus purpuratus]|uniref:Uncharacterized protein n=1 Tax=Strongylocentrotus purpuratus TaxID=7668 RepID=A0A7M7HMS5_STRPU|nr:uncharacterized protein LOC100891453 [Strongylocentrotus purpuratus]XP_011673985.1 uncharacterized protein LOC100891453 [Strongylocentrotus purpuratus]|eukprot:XP_003723310.2 PREDICTED: uncharacterized protein LOC100891453 [Strongylocentrotus purpuratus]